MQNHSLVVSAFEKITARWKRYRNSMQTRNELALLRPDEIAALAEDLGLSTEQFKYIMNRGPHAADELLDVMKTLGIDVERIKSRDRDGFNGMKLICAECRWKSVCRRSLKRGTIARDYGAFCRNADLLEEYRKRKVATTI
jgi:uncharacterized protein YjiS (DUF1127 family)